MFAKNTYISNCDRELFNKITQMKASVSHTQSHPMLLSDPAVKKSTRGHDPPVPYSPGTTTIALLYFCISNGCGVGLPVIISKRKPEQDHQISPEAMTRDKQDRVRIHSNSTHSPVEPHTQHDRYIDVSNCYSTTFED